MTSSCGDKLEGEGAATDDEIDDAVEQWHERGTGELHDWLGWTFAEYADWVRFPDKIPQRPLPLSQGSSNVIR